MYITYTPEETGQAQRWTFDPTKIRASEAEIIEKRYGQNWDAWQAAVQSGNMRARRVLLWHLLKREHLSLRWEDTPDFLAGEVLVEHSVAELQAIRDRVAKANLPDDQREQIFTALDAEITDAMAKAEARDEEPEGKAPSKSAASATP
ncbi:hypothetical protein Aph01nite_74060 [Acrocarpospora phusangensis]|uniref:Uncharacterized protein n=1 Tax=Acrocarpospora phusangensis TaxID=1070424 RepID=A0A919QHU9_9ACTN|nr:hypothetical protein [Acrocarpospora phusangensis]GIH29096.1 hypothetical protein Aph01nite_74060 [Acrocarpospora phusangensis]